MITRRVFIGRAAAAVAAIAGMVAYRLDHMPLAAGQGTATRSRALRVMEVRPAKPNEIVRVRQRPKYPIRPQPKWNVRTFRYQKTSAGGITFGADIELDAILLADLGFVPIGDPLPRGLVITMPTGMTVPHGETIDFNIDRSALDYPAPIEARYLGAE